MDGLAHVRELRAGGKASHRGHGGHRGGIGVGGGNSFGGRLGSRAGTARRGKASHGGHRGGIGVGGGSSLVDGSAHVRELREGESIGQRRGLAG
jgi:hypothetical protein